MKKLIVASLLLFASQGIFAQYDWSKLSSEYLEMFTTAESISEETDKISTDETGVTIHGQNLALTFQRKLILNSTKEHFKYYLVKTDGRPIKLDKLNTEKVLRKYKAAVDGIKEDLEMNRGAQINDILSTFFTN